MPQVALCLDTSVANNAESSAWMILLYGESFHFATRSTLKTYDGAWVPMTYASRTSELSHSCMRSRRFRALRS